MELLTQSFHTSVLSARLKQVISKFNKGLWICAQRKPEHAQGEHAPPQHHRADQKKGISLCLQV